jgi:dimethylargininase
VRALVRRPSPRLGAGILTHVERQPIDHRLARTQWEAYVAALEDAGWEAIEVPPADDCPDGVFVEDAVVVYGELALVTRPGAPARRAELDGVAQAVANAGYTVARIEAPGTLDGGDVLKIRDTIYVGISSRTNVEGARQLRKHFAEATVI